MPLRLHVRHLAQNAFVDHLARRLVILAVTALQSDLQNLLRMLGRQLPQGVYLFGLEHQALLAEHVLARLQAVARRGEVQEQRHGDEDAVHVLLRQQLAVVLELLGIAPGNLGAFLEIGLIDVAHGDAMALIGLIDVLQQVTAAAAGSNEAVLDLVVGGPHLLNPGRGNYSGRRSAGRLQ